MNGKKTPLQPANVVMKLEPGRADRRCGADEKTFVPQTRAMTVEAAVTAD